MIADLHSDGPGRGTALVVAAGLGAVWKWAPDWLPVIGYAAAGAVGLFLAAGVAGAIAGHAMEAARARKAAASKPATKLEAQNFPVQAAIPVPATTPPPKPSPAPQATPMGRQQQVAEFVRDFRAQRGREPTFSEVRNGLGLPKSSASKYLDIVLKQQAQG